MCFIKNQLNKRKVKKIAEGSRSEPDMLGLIVGHTRKSPGARNKKHDVYEYHFWDNLVRNEILEKPDKWPGVRIRVFWRDEYGISGAVGAAVKAGCTALVELHANAFNEQVRGCEVLVSDNMDLKGTEERVFGRSMAENLNKVMQNPLRGEGGLRYRTKKGERGFYNLTRVFDRPSILIEPFFIDNDEEFLHALAHQKELAEAIVNSFKVFKGLD